MPCRDTARALRADVLHGHGAKGGAFARLAARELRADGRNVATFYTPHGGSLHYPLASPQGLIYTAVEKYLARYTDGLIFESDFIRRVYNRRIGAGRVPERVIPNALQPDDFTPHQPNANAADFLFIGELRHLKGVDVLLQALARIAAFEPVRAVIVGAGPDAEAFKTMARELQLDGLIDFPGAMPARDAFPLGRCLVVPSRAESMPYIVLEAAAAAMPLLATNVGGIPEIVNGTDTAADAAGRCRRAGAGHAGLPQRAGGSKDACFPAQGGRRRPLHGRARRRRGAGFLCRAPRPLTLTEKLTARCGCVPGQWHEACFRRAVLRVTVTGSQSKCSTLAKLQSRRQRSRTIAHKIPRLADFRIEDKTRLMSMVVIRGAVRACDLAIICLLGLAVALFYVDEPVIIGNTCYMAALAMTAVVTVAGFDMLGLYSQTAFNSFIRQMPRVLLAWTAAFAMLLAGVFFLKVGHDFSRVWFAAWYVTGIVVLLGERLVVASFVRTGRARAASIAAPRSTAAAPSPRSSSASSRSTSTATSASPACSTIAAMIASIASSPATRVSAA